MLFLSLGVYSMTITHTYNGSAILKFSGFVKGNLMLPLVTWSRSLEMECATLTLNQLFWNPWHSLFKLSATSVYQRKPFPMWTCNCSWIMSRYLQYTRVAMCMTVIVKTQPCDVIGANELESSVSSQEQTFQLCLNNGMHSHLSLW